MSSRPAASDPAPPAATGDYVDVEVRVMIARLLGIDAATVAALPAATPLLSGPLGLRSVDGARLLTEVAQKFGVDVATEDIALQSLESIGTLVAFVAARYKGTP